MPRRPTSTRRTSKRTPFRSDPAALRARFLIAAARKGLQHLGQHTPRPGTPPVAAARSMLDMAIDAYLRYKWYRDVEGASTAAPSSCTTTETSCRRRIARTSSRSWLTCSGHTKRFAEQYEDAVEWMAEKLGAAESPALA